MIEELKNGEKTIAVLSVSLGMKPANLKRAELSDRFPCSMYNNKKIFSTILIVTEFLLFQKIFFSPASKLCISEGKIVGTLAFLNVFLSLTSFVEKAENHFFSKKNFIFLGLVFRSAAYSLRKPCDSCKLEWLTLSSTPMCTEGTY